MADQVVFVAELDQGRIKFDSQGRLLVIDESNHDLVAISAVVEVPALSWLGGLTLGVVLMLVGVSTHARRRCWKTLPML